MSPEDLHGEQGLTVDSHTFNRIETELRHLKRMIHETPFMLTRCSRDMRYVFVSRAYAEMLGREPSEIEGRAIVDIMGEEGLATIRPYVEEVLAGRRVEYESDCTLRGRAGGHCTSCIALTSMQKAR